MIDTRLPLRTLKGRVLLSVRVQPRAAQTEVSGIEDGRLRIRVRAAPVDGAANKALLKFLGKKLLRTAPSALTIVRGDTGREKTIAISGLSESEVRERITRALDD